MSLTAEGRGILEDCLRELEKQVFLSLRISTSQPETQWAAASSDAEFVSSEHDPYESASTAMSSPERVSSPEQTEPEMYEDGEGELFFWWDEKGVDYIYIYSTAVAYKKCTYNEHGKSEVVENIRRTVNVFSLIQ